MNALYTSSSVLVSKYPTSSNLESSGDILNLITKFPFSLNGRIHILFCRSNSVDFGWFSIILKYTLGSEHIKSIRSDGSHCNNNSMSSSYFDQSVDSVIIINCVITLYQHCIYQNLTL